MSLLLVFEEFQHRINLRTPFEVIFQKHPIGYPLDLTFLSELLSRDCIDMKQTASPQKVCDLNEQLKPLFLLDETFI